MANERKKGSVIRESERVGSHYPESHYENPFNDGIDKWYAEGDDKRTLESPSANTIGHVGLKMDKGRDDKDCDGK